MSLRLSLTSMACGLLALCCGCSTPGAAFRGQSYDGGAAASPTGYNPHHFGGLDAYHEQVYDQFHGSATAYGAIGPWSPAAVDGGMPVYVDEGSWAPAGPGDAAGGWRGLLPSERREQRMINRGILPPPGSPYASGYQATYVPNGADQPVREVNGVKVYDGNHGNGRHVGPCPNGCPPPPGWVNGAYDFWPGGCPYCGADFVRHAPTHYHTYSYKRPNDLVYPSPNSVGGAVVYSYYTLRGPSDFFRDDDRGY